MKHSPIKILVLLLIIFHTLISLLSAERSTGEANDEVDDLTEFMDNSMKEIDFYMLEELLDVEVEVASLFPEDELVVASSVSNINERQWKIQGAKRTDDALMNELSVLSYRMLIGATGLAIRGYATATSIVGTATLLDNIPVNAMSLGTSTSNLPNWELGTLNKIEIIKGPGSAIYGTDAFHGVLSMKTFESDKNYYSASIAGAFPVYGDANVKISQGLFNDLLRIDLTAGGSYQADEDLKYEYIDDGRKGFGKYKNEYSSQCGVIKLKINPLKNMSFKFSGYAGRWDSEDFNTISYNENGSSLRDNDMSSGYCKFYMGSVLMSYIFKNNISIDALTYIWSGLSERSLSYSPAFKNQYILSAETDIRQGADIIIKQPENEINLQWMIAYSYNLFKAKETSGKIKNKLNGDTLLDIGSLPYDGVSTEIHSIYSQAKWGIIKNTLYAVAGCRLDNYPTFGNQITPRAAVIYQPTIKAAIKALYGRAFRAPSSTELYGQSMIFYGNESLDPQTIDIFELILMHKEKSWKSSLTIFYSNWKNGIVLDEKDNLPANYTYTYINKGENRSYGAELKFFYSIDPFAFDTGYAYNHGEAIDVTDPDDPEGTKKITQEYDAFPSHSFIVGLYYTIKPININFFLNNRLYADYYEVPDDVRPVKANLPRDKIFYYRMDLNINKSITDEFEATLNIRNLLNRNNHTPSMYGSLNGYKEPGISVLLRINYSF